MSTTDALGFEIHRKGSCSNKDFWFEIGYEESDDAMEDDQPVNTGGFIYWQSITEFLPANWRAFNTLSGNRSIRSGKVDFERFKTFGLAEMSVSI